MNESIQIQLKILVERTVRSVRATIGRKRKMREELMAHLTAVFEEETKLGDERTALERTWGVLLRKGQQLSLAHETFIGLCSAVSDNLRL